MLFFLCVCVCVWWFDTSQSMEQCTAVLSVIAIFEFEKMNICGCQWKYRPNFAGVERQLFPLDFVWNRNTPEITV